jgi:hypothetical protein
MPIISTAQSFSSGDQVTAQKLEDIANQASFLTASGTATDGATLEVHSTGGYLLVKEDGITSNELRDDPSTDENRAVTTNHIRNSNVTTAKIADSAVEFDKIQNISTAKVLGRTAAGAGVVGEVDIKDENDFVSDSNTALATQQSIKAYVDNSIPDTSQLLRAKCTFDGSSTNPSANTGAFNILSITKNATGDYTVTFDNAVTNPVACVTALQAQNTNPMDASIHTINSSTVRIITGTNTTGRIDLIVHLIVF